MLCDRVALQCVPYDDLSTHFRRWPSGAQSPALGLPEDRVAMWHVCLPGVGLLHAISPSSDVPCHSWLFCGALADGPSCKETAKQTRMFITIKIQFHETT